MKKFLSFLILIVMGVSVQAQTSTTSTKSSEKVIVIDTNDPRMPAAPNVFVESGSDTVTGSPEENIKAAYRTWDSACSNWKAELKALNKGNLLIATCGEAKRREERIQSKAFYTYASKASYKIRVIGK